MDHDTQDPAPEQIEDETGWHPWRGVNDLWYASHPKSSPPIVLCEENTTELLAQIRAWERQR